MPEQQLPTVRVRMYRQGLGDCFLVSFHTGDKPVHILIDCGTLGKRATHVEMQDVIKDIKAETEGHLDVLVATHEHKDHVSGFGGDHSVFDEADFTVDRVWVAWTEDPSDADAKRISKHKGDLKLAVSLTATALTTSAGLPAEQADVQGTSAGMREILGFFGDFENEDAFAASLAKGVDSAMRYVTERAGTRARFLKPGDLIEEKWLSGVRVYVLGPPRDEAALRNMGQHGSDELYSLAAQFVRDMSDCVNFNAAAKPLEEYKKLLGAEERQRFETRLPFDPRFRIECTDEAQCRKQFESYYAEDNAWRRFDNDWLSGGAEMAMQLDSYTNNTSLALAFELIEDGRVLLFPADAQVGNWLSWHEHAWAVGDENGEMHEVKAENLLARTVFYKVGHHASHNATIKERGLELMQRDDLVAMIPVDRQVAMNKTPPWRMPAEPLYKRLVEKTSGRVVRSDTGWPEDKHRPPELSEKQWDLARKEAGVTVEDLYIDYKLP